MHHFRIFIFLIVVFLRRRADRLGGAGGGGGGGVGGRGSLGGWMWDVREGGGSPGPQQHCVSDTPSVSCQALPQVSETTGPALHTAAFFIVSSSFYLHAEPTASRGRFL